MTEKFTPGPWNARYNGHFWDITPTYDVGGWRGDVAAVHDASCISGITENESEANAHLIAAAPELFRAVKMLFEYEALLEGNDDVSAMLTYAEMRAVASAAIRKVRGES